MGWEWKWEWNGIEIAMEWTHILTCDSMSVFWKGKMSESTSQRVSFSSDWEEERTTVPVRRTETLQLCATEIMNC